MGETASAVVTVIALLFGPLLYAAFKFTTMTFGCYFISEIISDYFKWPVIEAKYFLAFFALAFVARGVYNMAR